MEPGRPDKRPDPATAASTRSPTRTARCTPAAALRTRAAIPTADHLAVWDGQAWAPACGGAQHPYGGNVKALQVIGSTLYIGGEFQDGAGLGSAADYLVACDLATGTPSATLGPGQVFSGAGVCADRRQQRHAVCRRGLHQPRQQPGGRPRRLLLRWHVARAGLRRGAACQCAVDDFVRSLTAVGTDVYVGTDVKDVAGIAQADNVARWTGSEWSAVGSNAAGTDGWFPASTFIYALTSFDSKVFAAGSFQNAAGDPDRRQHRRLRRQANGARSAPTGPATGPGAARGTGWRSSIGWRPPAIRAGCSRAAASRAPAATRRRARSPGSRWRRSRPSRRPR